MANWYCQAGHIVDGRCAELLCQFLTEIRPEQPDETAAFLCPRNKITEAKGSTVAIQD